MCTEAAGFQEVEHRADRAVRVWAPSREELFAQAGQAMFALMADLQDLRPICEHQIDLPADDWEAMLVEWLNELLYWQEREGELYCQFAVSFDAGKLMGRFAGQPAQPTLAVIKAATFHNLHVCQAADGRWSVDIIFDT